MKRKVFIVLFISCFLIAAVTYKYPSFNTLEGAINYDYQNGKDLSKLYQFNNEAFAVSASQKSYHEFSHYVKKMENGLIHWKVVYQFSYILTIITVKKQKIGTMNIMYRQKRIEYFWQ